MTLQGFDVPALLKGTGREILDDDVPGLAAGAAYNFFLAVFPLLLFLAPVLALVGDRQQTMLTLLNVVGGSLPPAAFDLFRGVLRDVVFARGAPGLMTIGAIGALWAGSNIFSTLISALNQAFDVTETRSWLRRRLLAVGAAILTGLVLLSVTALILGGERIIGAFGFGDATQSVIAWIQFPLAAAILVPLAMLNFSMLPDVRVRWRYSLTGALFTVTLWLVVTALFRLYVQNFGSYNRTYGTIGGVIVLLIWMWLSMIALLAGGELASELHHGTGRIVRQNAAVDAHTGRLASTPAFAVASNHRVARIDPLAGDL